MSAEGKPDRMAQEAETWRKTAEKILKGMPPPAIPLLPTEHASDISRYKNRPDLTVAEAWQKCSDAIERHDEDICKAHREEIDTLLVFAGLFSAVITAFTIESYQWLQDDPNDAIISLLSQMVHPSRSAPVPNGLARAVSARINTYWFLSLTLSLSAALVAILCKQWIREFERHADQSHRQYISIRQMKFEGFEGWGVASIVTVIPLLLQSALGLFALGLIELLWNLHTTVAIAVLVPTAAALLFYALTTLLPGLQYMCAPVGMHRTLPQCPFKSPQSMLTLRVLAIIHSCFIAPLAALTRRLQWWLARRRWFPELVWPFAPVAGIRNQPEFGTFNRSRFSISRLRPEHLESWITLDREFNHARDMCYGHQEYARDLQNPGRAVPLRSCFRGLAWLRDHIDQPGVQRRIWMASWDIVTTPDCDYWSAHHGVLNLFPQRRRAVLPKFMSMSVDIGACGLMSLLHAAIGPTYDLDFGPAFKAELVVQHLPLINPSPPDDAFKSYKDFLDEESKHSWLHAVITRRLASDVGKKDVIHGLGLLPLRIGHNLGESMSQEELACLIALSFEALHLCVEGTVDHQHHLRHLSRLFHAYLAPPGAGDSDLDARGSPDVKTAFATLRTLVPVLLDQEFEQATTCDDYALRGSSAAVNRFQRTVAQLARTCREIRSREPESPAVVPVPMGPSERPSLPRGNEARTRVFLTEHGDAGPIVPSHSGSDLSAAAGGSGDTDLGSTISASPGDDVSSSPQLAFVFSSNTWPDSTLSAETGDDTTRPKSSLGHETRAAAAPIERLMVVGPKDSGDASSTPESLSGQELRTRRGGAVVPDDTDSETTYTCRRTDEK